MAKIWKVAHLKMVMFSVKVLMIIIIATMTAKMYRVRHGLSILYGLFH